MYNETHSLHSIGSASRRFGDRQRGQIFERSLDRWRNWRRRWQMIALRLEAVFIGNVLDANHLAVGRCVGEFTLGDLENVALMN